MSNTFNAILGEPLPFTVIGGTDIGLTNAQWDNLTNDEPGLIWKGSTAQNNWQFDLDLGADFALAQLRGVCVLGLPAIGGTVTIRGSTDSAFSAPVVLFTGNANFSANRSNFFMKSLATFAPTALYRYIRVSFALASPIQLYSWRIVPFGGIQPDENIEIGAEVSMDDRSVRRYTRGGRINIDPTVICPGFSGSWSWLTEAESIVFNKYLRKRSASYPFIFILDPSNHNGWGEDDVYFGHLEKDCKVQYNEGCWSFSLRIVSIAA